MDNSSGWWFKVKKHLAVRLALMQLLTLGVIALIVSFFSQPHALSLIAGGLVSIIPHFFFGVRALRTDKSGNATWHTSQLVLAMLSKLVLTAMLFVVVWRLPVLHQQPLSVFAGFVLAMIPQWIYPAFMKQN